MRLPTTVVLVVGVCAVLYVSTSQRASSVVMQLSTVQHSIDTSTQHLQNQMDQVRRDLLPEIRQAYYAASAGVGAGADANTKMQETSSSSSAETTPTTTTTITTTITTTTTTHIATTAAATSTSPPITLIVNDNEDLTPEQREHAKVCELCNSEKVTKGLKLMSVSPLIQALTLFRYGDDSIGPGFDYGFYRVMYPEFRGKSRGEIDNDFNTVGNAAGRMRHPFYDYEKTYSDGDRERGGLYVATRTTLDHLVVWDRREGCTCQQCPCLIRAFSLCDAIFINAADSWHSQFIMGDKLIAFGNIFLSDIFHLQHERGPQFSAITNWVRDWRDKDVVVVSEQAFSLVTPVSIYMWHVTHDLLQFIYVYHTGGFNCSVIVNYTWMHDLIAIFIPRERIKVFSGQEPILFRNLILVSNFHSLIEVAPISLFIQPFMEKARTPNLPPIPLAIICRRGDNAWNPGLFGPAIENWYREVINAGAQELRVGKGGMSLGEQIGMMHTVKTLVVDWGSAMANAWWMASGSLMFSIVHPTRVDQMDPTIPLGKFMEPYGVHMYPLIVDASGAFDTAWALSLLRKVEQICRDGFKWREFRESLGLVEELPMEYNAINLYLRREQWPGHERLPQVDNPKVHAAFNK